MKVNVYINGSKSRFASRSYKPSDLLTLALTFEAEAESPLVLCDQVFAALNCDTPAPVGTLDRTRIKAYRKVFPSLSVGDIVEVDGQKYDCRDVGWLPTKVEKPGPKFPILHLGRIVATPGVLALGVDTNALLTRHVSGDWGDLDAEDKATNENGLLHGERLMSSYETPKGTVWVITERDRSVTTLLLPEDY